MNKFFQENKEDFDNFLKKLEINKSELENKELIISIVKEMILRESNSYSGSFNSCTFNIENTGRHLLNNIRSQNIEEKWIEIVTDIVRFCKEFELKTDSYIPEVKNLLSYYTKEFLASGSETNEQIYYALTKMPLVIMEEIYSKKYNNFRNDIDKEINTIIEQKLPDKKVEIDKIKEDNDNYIKQLRGFKQEFSFLALNQAFNKLEKSKQLARYISLIFLLLLAVTIVYIPYFYYEKSFLIKQMTEIFNLTLDNKNSSMSLFILFSGLIPMIFIESIFLYYFKIVLNKYNSITDQIVQLETKQAIMQFIESYINYKKDNNIKHEEMSKFEEIIFSQISPNLKDIPSSPDLVSLIDSISKAIRGSK
jgi:hypothetical protein